MDLTALKKKLVMGARIMHRERLIEPVGHISARVPGTDNFLITPRRSPGLATRSQLLILDLDGHVLEGNSEPNSEWYIHAEIYRRRPDVGAICHVHPFHTIVLGTLAEPFQPVHNWGATFGAGVGYYDEICLVRTREQGVRLAEDLGDKRAVLMRGHGATVVGANIEEAVIGSIELEYNAQIQVTALAAGRPYYYSREESDGISGHPPRFWEYYVARVQGQLDQPLPPDEL